ncbi:YheU family protein [Oligoflexus tunisiensis]|uniref:YheU family protein n=1 Tax=Oligoflexus tunisiensis TaxID=708132 RepID=UPI001C4065E0|nr:YheU family protein [Oligoflexus tunisiensis]
MDRLDAETLTRVIEEYVSREGTDYGHSSPDLLAKVEGIRRKLKSGEAVLCFDEVSETCHILSREAWRSLQKGGVTSTPAPSLDMGSDL